MDADLKKTLKAVTLELRHLLEGRYDQANQWKPGDLEQRLAAIGVRRDRASVPVDEFGHLAEEDRQARKVVDAYLKLRDEAGVKRSEAVAEFVRETAYTWANRLLALRCMEARELIDSVILQQEAYAGRSLEHHRLAQRHPELCARDDDGLFAVLDKVFRALAGRLPMLFDPQAPGIALRPSAAALKDCFSLLSLNPDTLRKYRIRLTEDDTASPGAKPQNPFTAPDALGWAYQYWNTEEKDRVFERVRTVKEAKIAGADIIPATQLYTEDYMVKFLVQNSLGATWMGMHPESRLAEKWEYYVKDADLAPVEKKPVREIAFLDPACGSGHFHLEAFDLFYAMYLEEGELTAPEEICNAILTKNLFGIDIDPRAVQIAEVVLWMKAAERAFEYQGVPTNLVAATSSHLKGEAWEEFLAGFEREPSVARVLRSFARTMEHIDEIGSLARPAEDLREIIKEEHATWERQVREREEANFLFPEMNEEALSGTLPFHEISDEEFGDRLFYRARAGIDAFTDRARASGNFEDQLLGSETRTGFRLMDLLGRRYDVVAANPPFMGKGNMSETLSRFCKASHPHSFYDLCMVFVERTRDLLVSGGFGAVLTQQALLTLPAYLELRRSFLISSAIASIVHLGTGAFESIGGAKVNPILLVYMNQIPSDSRQTTIIRLVNSRNKITDLARGCRADRNSLDFVYQHFQSAFLPLPRSMVLYSLPDRLLSTLAFQTLGSIAETQSGLLSGDNERLLRFSWEVEWCDKQFKPYTKGGPYSRWSGNLDQALRWDKVAKCFFDESPTTRLAGLAKYSCEGLTWSDLAGIGLSVRLLPKGFIFDQKGPAVFFPSERDQFAYLAFLNSSYARFLAQAFNPSLQIKCGDIDSMPLVADQHCCEQLAALGRLCVRLKQRSNSEDLTDHFFDARDLWTELSKSAAALAVLHTIEAYIDQIVFRSFKVSEDETVTIYREVGVPSGLLRCENADEKLRRVADLLDIRIDHEILFRLAQDTVLRGSRVLDDLPFGANDSWLERYSFELKLHPLDGFDRAFESSNRSTIANIIAGRQVDRVSTVTMQLLSHRWPKQVEAGEPIAEWADPDGIIPLTSMAKESSLFDRIRQHLRADEIGIDDFSEATGKPLNAWLATEFFKHHTTQFKKRPIAWQLQSGKFTAKKSPAFACFLYYHKVDTDTLPKLQSQYLGPLRQRLETELRGIMSVATDTRSDRQVKRRRELEDAILEMQKFDSLLETVARTGFGPQSMLPKMRQYAIDDAMSALKVRWLGRLTELIAKAVLPGWLDAVASTGLHPDFGSWVEAAMAHFDHFCTKVGPKAPEQSKLTADPTAVDLAKLIAPQAEPMLTKALELACDLWYAKLDEVVLGPDKERIKELKQEQKDCEEQLDPKWAPTTTEIQRVTYRIMEIKEDIKILTAQIKRKTASAKSVRVKIESWRSPELATWGDWLAGQPLFDRVASSDGRRATPTTIAEFITQESHYAPDINDGVRVNIAPLQKAGILAADVLAPKDLDKAIADRAEWRADERRWVREGKLPQPGWWPENGK